MPTPTPQPQPLPDPNGRPGPHSPRPDPIPQPPPAPRKESCRAAQWAIRAWMQDMPVSGFMPGIRTFPPEERVKRIFPSARPMLADAGYIKTGNRRASGTWGR